MCYERYEPDYGANSYSIRHENSYFWLSNFVPLVIFGVFDQFLYFNAYKTLETLRNVFGYS